MLSHPAEPDCFSLLVAELERLGMNHEAEALKSAVASGSTGSEILGLAGQAIASLQLQHPREAAGVLRPFIAPCIAAIRRAWPSYPLSVH